MFLLPHGQNQGGGQYKWDMQSSFRANKVKPCKQCKVQGTLRVTLECCLQQEDIFPNLFASYLGNGLHLPSTIRKKYSEIFIFIVTVLLTEMENMTLPHEWQACDCTQSISLWLLELWYPRAPLGPSCKCGPGSQLVCT